MKKIILLLVSTCLMLYSNSLSVIKYGGTIEDIASVSKIAKLSSVTQKSLSYQTKAENIQSLLTLAVKEKKVGYVEQFKYYEKFQNIENGDKLLLKALQNNKSLNDVLSKQSTSYKLIEATRIVGTRAQMKTLGLVNDTKLYPIKNSKGIIIGNFRAPDFYDTSKIIQMPSIIFTIGSKTSTGYLRNSKKYWKQYSKKFPKDLSKENLAKIKRNESPIVDSTWLKSYQNHKYFKGEKLEHHHLHHNGGAVPLPKTLHRIENKQVFHTM